MRFARPLSAIALALLTGFASHAQAPVSRAVNFVYPLPDGSATAPVDTRNLATCAALGEIKDLHRFHELLIRTGMGKRLSKPTSTYTVFAPLNSAFDRVPAGVQQRLFAFGNPNLPVLLRSHIVEGTIMPDQLRDGMELKTLAGTTLKVAQHPDGSLWLDGVYPIKNAGDITANGIIYSVDALLPTPN